MVSGTQSDLKGELKTGRSKLFYYYLENYRDQARSCEEDTSSSESKARKTRLTPRYFV
jgi:hypothetical protein